MFGVPRNPVVSLFAGVRLDRLAKIVLKSIELELGDELETL